MMSGWKKQWRALRGSRPGERFADRYAAANRGDGGRQLGGHIARVALAFVAFVIGVVLVFVPGPAVVFFAVTGALLASESLGVARGLDWTELRLREAARWLLRRWRALSLAGKAAVGVLTVSLAAGAAYGAFRVLVA
jgi:hypothetical protein